MLQVKKDRAYTILFGDTAKEFIMPAAVVNGLTRLNQPGHRENAKKDNSFLKAILLCMCPLETIQSMPSGAKPAKEIMNFMKDLFIHRLAGDKNASRYLSYKDLILKAIEEVKNGDFN